MKVFAVAVILSAAAYGQLDEHRQVEVVPGFAQTQSRVFSVTTPTFFALHFQKEPGFFGKWFVFATQYQKPTLTEPKARPFSVLTFQTHWGKLQASGQNTPEYHTGVRIDDVASATSKPPLSLAWTFRRCKK